MDPISDHSVVDRPACRNLVTGQQTHYTRVPMVELDHNTGQKKKKKLLVYQEEERVRPLSF